MSKILRRRILIVAGTPPQPGQAGWTRADVEDDQHRFGITVRHDGQKLLAVESDASHRRHPWTQCPNAVENLPRLIGMMLDPHPQAAYAYTRSAEQCTHMFDMASLAAAHAARGTARRLYDVEVDCEGFRAEKTERGYTFVGNRHLKLFRDGTLALDWPLEGDVIMAGPQAGQNVRTMMDWVKAHITDLDEIEAISIARRTLIVTISLLFDMDTLPTRSAGLSSRTGACYAYQPVIMETLTRAQGNSRHFADKPEALLADLNPREK